MRKRLLAIIATAAMVVAMIPSMVFAANGLPDADANGKIALEGNVTLTGDVTLNAAEFIVVKAGKTVVLDLNGHTISLTRTGNLSAYDQLISNYGNLTIKDSSTSKTGSIEYKYTGPTVSQGFAANTITNNPGATLIVDGGTVENKTTTSHTTYSIDTITNGSVGGKDTKLIVNGGLIKAIKGDDRGVALRACLNSTVYKNVVEINGGEIVGGYAALQIHGISNQANKSEVTVNGGEFDGSGNYAMYSYFESADGSNVDITINDGDFSGYVFLYNPKNGSSDKPFKAEINGGTFDNGAYIYNKDANGGKVSVPAIKGGNFGVEPDEAYIAEGAKITQNSDGTFSVAVPAPPTEKPVPEKSPNTGDNSMAPIAVAGLVMAAMAAVVATRRRTN